MESSIWLKSTPEQKVILVVLMLMANHSDNNWEWEGKPYICKAGEFITSVRSIKKRCGLGISRQNIRTAIQRFKKLEFLTIEVTNVNSLVTICKWETYQSEKIEPNQPSNQQLTNPQPTPNQPLTTNKKVKNENKVKKKKGFVPPTLEEVQKYIKENDYDLDAKKFFKYFTDGGWIDSRGNPVRNWKQKIITWSGTRNGSKNSRSQHKPDKRDFSGQESKFGKTIE